MRSHPSILATLCVLMSLLGPGVGSAVGDLNHDGVLSNEDRVELATLRAYEPDDEVSMADPGWTPEADLDFDGVIDEADLDIVSSLVDQGGVSEPGALWVQQDFFLRGLTIGYAGMPYDDLAGAWLMRSRWHSPTLGRFISRDPAGYVDGMSLYAYVSGNPLKYWDPFGLCIVPEATRYEGSSEQRYFDGLRDIRQDLVDPTVEAAASDVNATLDAGQAALDAAGLIPGVGIAPNLLNAGISLLRGRVGAAAVSLAAAVPVIGLLPGGAKVINRAGSAICASDKAADAGTSTANVVDEAFDAGGAAAPNRVPGQTVGDLRAARSNDAHHIIQDAAVRDIPGYNRNAAPGVQFRGPSTQRGTPHYRATQVQRQRGGGTYAAERRIAYKALRRAGLEERDARMALDFADEYFRSIGVDPQTATRPIRNRR